MNSQLQTHMQVVGLPQNVLQSSGFTNSGITQYQKTLVEYNEILLHKSISYAEVDKPSNGTIEVTHEHVRRAAHSIANSYGKPVKPKWLLPVQVGQYIFAAGCGFCGGFLNQTAGLIGFVCCFIIGGILFVLEKNNGN